MLPYISGLSAGALPGASGTPAGGGGAGGGGGGGGGAGSRQALPLSSDYLCLLGLAETLAPGTYVRLAGDPDVLESRFVELFESF